MSTLPTFTLPEVHDFSAGWGPAPYVLKATEIPIQPYNKSEKLGAVSDWTAVARFTKGMSL